MTMTAQEQTTEVLGFKAAKVRVLPTLACLGVVKEVGEAVDTGGGEGVYDMIRITLNGVQGSRGGSINFLFRPEWFRPEFDPDTLNLYTEIDPKDGKQIGPKMYSVYRMHIQAEGSELATLKGLCGSEERFVDFCRLRNDAYATLVKTAGPTDKDGNPTEFTRDEIRDLLNGFLTADGVTIGYELSQGREKAGKDENGRQKYRLTDRYEVGSLKFYDETLIKNWTRRATNAAKTAENLLNQGKGDGQPSFRLAFEQ